MSRALAILCVALCTSCRLAPPFHTFMISPLYTELERTIIVESANAWNELSRFDIEFARPEDTSRQVVPITPVADWPYDGMHYAGSIYTRAGLPTMRFRYVMRHEFGHVLGLRHHEGPGVMVTPGSNDPTITERDYSECVSVGACDAR